jgi:hypothetical protein
MRKGVLTTEHDMRMLPAREGEAEEIEAVKNSSVSVPGTGLLYSGMTRGDGSRR